MPQVEQLTIASDPPRHYCGECADTKLEVITALELAYHQGLLHLLHDGEVQGEMCASCQRPIATVPAPLSTYRAEVTVTIQVAVELVARSETSARYTLRPVLENVLFESAQADIGDVLAEEIPEAEDVVVEDCWCELDNVQKSAEGE